MTARARTTRAGAARAALLLLLALGGAASCKSAVDRVFARPDVAFRGVRVGTIGIAGGSLDVVLAVANANPYALSARQVTYRLLAGDSTEVGRGATTQPVTIAARDSALIHLPLDVTWRGLRQVGREALSDGTVSYRVVGEIVVETPVGARTFPFDERGRFAALGAPR
jgi:LEA14-like dessication related protein